MRWSPHGRRNSKKNRKAGGIHRRNAQANAQRRPDCARKNLEQDRVFDGQVKARKLRLIICKNDKILRFCFSANRNFNTAFLF